MDKHGSLLVVEIALLCLCAAIAFPIWRWLSRAWHLHGTGKALFALLLIGAAVGVLRFTLNFKPKR